MDEKTNNIRSNHVISLLFWYVDNCVCFSIQNSCICLDHECLDECLDSIMNVSIQNSCICQQTSISKGKTCVIKYIGVIAFLEILVLYETPLINK